MSWEMQRGSVMTDVSFWDLDIKFCRDVSLLRRCETVGGYTQRLVTAHDVEPLTTLSITDDVWRAVDGDVSQHLSSFRCSCKMRMEGAKPRSDCTNKSMKL
jgi:hypothetical protein